MRKILKIIVCILILILFSKVLTTKQKYNYEEEITEEFEIKDEMSDNSVIEIVQEDNISQWALANSGEKIYSPQFSNEWEADERTPKKGIDINYSKEAIEINRKVNIAIIDTGIDITQINENNLWRNKGEIPDDGIDNDGNGFIDDYFGWNFCDVLEESRW